MTHIFLVRHGEAQYGLAEKRRLVGGMRDLVPLTELGREQARQAAAKLADCGIKQVLASPMTRAMETAHIIACGLQVPLAVEFDLHEWLPDLSCSYDSAAFVSNQADEMHAHGGEWPTGGQRSWEPLSKVRGRVLAALRRHDEDTPAAVAIHGTVIYALTGRKVGNCEIVTYRLPDKD